jgi:hypothetical protein
MTCVICKTGRTEPGVRTVPLQRGNTVIVGRSCSDLRGLRRIVPRRARSSEGRRAGTPMGQHHHRSQIQSKKARRPGICEARVNKRRPVRPQALSKRRGESRCRLLCPHKPDDRGSSIQSTCSHEAGLEQQIRQILDPELIMRAVLKYMMQRK